MRSQYADRERRLAGIAADVRSEEPEPDLVWAVVAPGRKRLMPRAQAKERGYELDTAPPRSDGFPASNTYRLSTEERRKIHLQTGVHVEDYANYKRVCREKGWRDEEKGESGLERKKQIVEWVDSGAQGECPAGRHGLSVAPRQKPTQLDEYIARRMAGY